MPKCQCAGSSCGCMIQGGAGVTVTGVGSADRPYTITSAPLYVEENLEAGDIEYELGSRGAALSARSVFHLDFLEPEALIILPDGTGASALPPYGSQIELFVNGQPGGEYTFGGLISWAGALPPAPPADARGFYRFTLFADPLPYWIGEFVGLIVV